MRLVLVAAVLLFALASGRAGAADLRHFDDAALHAVQFVDRNEGWAVGDEGCVWHSINGGRTWERQATGVRASLRAVHFLNPYIGWVVGREELPHRGGSVGVLLFTEDGGLSWKRGVANSLPGLHRIQFFNEKVGFVAGDGTDAVPSGLFKTENGGRTWQPVRGPRVPAWWAADFQSENQGVLAGTWGRLATLRDGRLAAVESEFLSGRHVQAVQVVGQRAVAVGQGGLVLLSRDTAGGRWSFAELPFPTETRASWDFQGLHCVGDRIWCVGRPGSAILHSPDQGQTWSVQKTGHPLPLHAVWFLPDALNGWAVGTLGTILGTGDGGKTWRLLRRGGSRAGVLFVHARADALPWDTAAKLAAEDGYLTAAVRVAAPDPATAPPRHALDAARLTAALRRVGGTSGEMLWQFPLPQHLQHSDRTDLEAAWDKLHAGRSGEELLRHLVLTLRIWRPALILTDNAETGPDHPPADALVVATLQQAFQQAGDPKAFPEQLEQLGLEPWEAAKLYGLTRAAASAQVTLDLDDVAVPLEATLRDAAAAAATLALDEPTSPPLQRHFRLLASRLEGASGHRLLMQGIHLPPGGTARREPGKSLEVTPDVAKAARTRRNLRALAEADAGGLTDPNKLLAQIVPSLSGLPEHQGAPAAFAVGQQFARLGQWPLAREVFLAMVDRYPAHPLSADAYRWLIRHNASSEARRRADLKQFRIVTDTTIRPVEAEGPRPGTTATTGLERVAYRQITMLSSLKETRQWYRGSLEIGDRLAALGPQYATEPAVQFCLQAARRQLGEVEASRQWFTRFRDQFPPQSGAGSSDPWRLAAAAEVWLATRDRSPPRPVGACRQTATRPHLDGKLDDECWQGMKPLALQNASGNTLAEYATEARFAYDSDFLYLALTCRHPPEKHVAAAQERGRDADLRGFDRVSLMLDLDRDYATYFHLHVDQRGCVADDCWGDRTWNPRWFVALHSEKEFWQVEAAIPLVELTGEPVTVGKAWACNLVRVLPGRGVQAFSLPADVEPRPEGMGLLLYTAEPKR